MANLFHRSKGAKIETIRECVYCAYETEANRCPKCNGHSFAVYKQKRKKAA